MTNTTTKTTNINFRDYMSVPSGDQIGNLFDALNDAGVNVSTSETDFLASGCAEEDMQVLSENLGFWALWMEAKLKGFEALRDEGFEAIKATADLSGHVYHNTGDAEVGADWCRRDGVCYVKYGGMVQTAVASRYSSKRKRDVQDTGHAEHALELMYEHTRQRMVA